MACAGIDWGGLRALESAVNQSVNHAVAGTGRGRWDQLWINLSNEQSLDVLYTLGRAVDVLEFWINLTLSRRWGWILSAGSNLGQSVKQAVDGMGCKRWNGVEPTRVQTIGQAVAGTKGGGLDQIILSIQAAKQSTINKTSRSFIQTYSQTASRSSSKPFSKLPIQAPIRPLIQPPSGSTIKPPIKMPI